MRFALTARRHARVAPAAAIVVLAVLLETVLVGLHGLNAVALGDGRLLSLDQEQNLPTWFSSFQLGLAAVACFGIPLVERRGRPFWLAAGLLMAGMSIDEVAMLHEDVEATHGTASAILGWQLFAALGLALLLWLGGSRQSPDVRRWARLAAAAVLVAHTCSVLGSLVLEQHLEVVALSVAEEWAEMLMGTFALAAAAGVLARYVSVSSAPSS